MEILFKTIWALMLMTAYPYLLGDLLVYYLDDRYDDRCMEMIAYRFVMGFIVSLAVFHVIYFPLYFLQCSLNLLVVIYSIIIAAACLYDIYLRAIKNILPDFSVFRIKPSKIEYAIVTFFIVMVGIQIYYSVTYCHMLTVDDYEYVGRTNASLITNRIVSTIGGMGKYSIITAPTAKRAIESWEIWMAWLCRVTGMNAVTVSHFFLEKYLIVLVYLVMHLLSCALFKERKDKLAFLALISFILPFSIYSYYSFGGYMFLFGSQGRSVFMNIMIPVGIYLYYIILRKNYSPQNGIVLAVFSVAAISLSPTAIPLIIVFTALLIVVLLFRRCEYRRNYLYLMYGCGAPVVSVVLYLFLKLIYG